MNYLHWKVDAPAQGATAVVSLKGGESDVLVLDPSNFEGFRRGNSFKYFGGHYKRSPARLQFPSGGEWYVVVIPGPGGKVEASLQVF
ncbi:MAG: DUF1883 domain-containing protein [Acidimicrobiales bacterium]